MGFFDFLYKEKKEQLNKGLEKTKVSLFSKISKALLGKSKIDAAFLDDLEEILLSSDVGVKTTIEIINRIEKRATDEKFLGENELNKLLRDEISGLLDDNALVAKIDFDLTNAPKPYIIMVVGVNGVGKTTTIGKLANQFQSSGKKVLLGAADTFRAAAVDQLKIWGTRANVPVVALGMNVDPSAVAFDTVKKAVDEQFDVAIIDTAGRLHNKVGLMNELSKIKRVMQKVSPDAPHEILLVLDASTGQNAFEQAKQFTAATEVNALALTKLDGTAKGGVVIGISNEFKIPVKYIGVGEGINDLQIFNKYEFVDSLFGE
jgi:fused signal recognition particle receptor